MATRSNTLAVLNEPLGLWETLTPGDTIELAGLNLRITGDLIVTGNTVTTSSEHVLVADNYLYLNDGYTTAVVQRGGLVINRLPTATVDTVAATGFVAGVPAVSNPTVATTGSATFAVGDIIQISGATNVENNGLYEVLSHVGTLLTIRGVGLTATVEDFTDNNFTTDTTVAGDITKVAVAVIRTNSAGTFFEVGFGSVTPLSFTSLALSTTGTLQSAYDNDVDGGNANIVTTPADGAVVIAGTEKLQITAAAGLDVDTLADFDVTVFDVQMTGTNGFSIDGTAASNVSTTAGDLTLSTITSGAWIGASAGTLTLDAAGVLELNSSGGAISIGNDANAFAINIGTGVAARTLTYGNLTGATGQFFNTGTAGFTFRFQPADSDGFKVYDGTLTYIQADSTAGLEATRVPQVLLLSSGKAAGIELVAGEALVAGNPVRINASGEVVKADADTGTTTNAWVIGFNRAAVAAAGVAQILSVPGTLIPMKFAVAPAGASNGSLVYLSTVAGDVQLTPPSGSGSVTYTVGILQGADGATTTPVVLYLPQYQSKKP